MAYNTLRPFKIDCPICGVRSEHSPQFRTAASFSGDQTGRFHGRIYAFGDKLAWWPKSDPRYPEWREDSGQGGGGDGEQEILRLQCSNCRAELDVSIGFESLYIVGVMDITTVGQTSK